ncbi:type II toxin-antitoxin system PemK/MazF family toxin [Ectobacillus antri]|uniref:type II toxin-antitoxin system PemK/MazF family toxin n=1 Tax=Ectobacillus antri TaxID=2486280 RepID=UPI0013DD914E|nr:type II toxin-antitoxin system PemK/MazF family toxin [Ectobacillus antri]
MAAVSFKRGDVFYVNFTEVVYDPRKKDHVKGRPLPHTVLQGNHMAIVLSDDENHDDVQLSKQHVVVAPISSSKSAVANDKLLLTHVPLEVAKNPFLSQESYALLHQPLTIPIHWLREAKRRGRVHPDDMEVVSLVLLLSTGSSEHVQKIIKQAVSEAVKEYAEKSMQEGSSAASDE